MEESPYLATQFTFYLAVNFYKMKRDRIFYWVATGLLSAMLVMSASLYLVRPDEVALVFMRLGFPSWLIYPLAVAKLLAVVAIWTRISDALREWAYAGLFFDFALAFAAHWSISDGESAPALVAMVLLGLSYYFGKSMDARKQTAA